MLASFPPLFQFIVLLFVHWVADFVLQTHWQAANKSKRLDALGVHVLVYTVALGVGAVIIFGFVEVVIYFTLLNGFLHLATDFFTSRWSARHFAPAICDMYKIRFYADTYGASLDEASMQMVDADPSRHFHNFFVVIGLDQYLHQVALGVTMLGLLVL